MTLDKFTGYLTAADIKPNDYRNFLRHVEPSGKFHDDIECNRWTGAKNEYGYPKFGGPWAYAHRFMFLVGFGWLPKGRCFDVAHQCHHEWCVTYEHVEIETRRQNVLTRVRTRSDTCGSGHSKDVYGSPCRECNRLRTAQYYADHPEKKLEHSRRYEAKRPPRRR